MFSNLICKIFGHNWNNYREDVEYNLIGPISNNSTKILINTQFRICLKCNYKQARHHFTGLENKDWSECELNKSELRDKKINDILKK